MASVDDLLGTPVTPAGGLVEASATVGANANPATAGTSTLGPPATTAPYLGGIARLAPTQDRASISHYTVQPVVDVQALGPRPRSGRRDQRHPEDRRRA